MTTKKIHNALIFLSFFLPFLLYFQTMAPTVSLWDCGEFIATSIIMGIPHPPGTPLYLIIGNFFSQIPILSDLGARVNLISVIASALSIMLLYMIIVYLIEKINKKESKVAYYAAFIGAITFAVTDSQWFNAVEAEVYALSTLFTAIVVWLILKWDRETNKLGVKYLILIFYCMGLAIGIHLLNLLAIPFIALIIFFHYIQKTNKEVTIYNLLLLSIMTGLSFLIIYKGIIKGLPSIIDKTQNPLILSLFFIVIILSTIIINIKLNTKFNLLKHIAISSFSLMIIFITMNELVVTDYIDDIKNEKMGLEYAFEKDAAEMYNKILAANNINARDTHIDRWEEMVQEYTTKINNLDSTIKEIDANGFTYGLLISKQSGQSIFYLVIALMIVMAILSHYYTQHNKYNDNQYYKISQLIINCLFMVLLGYSTYALIFIRAQHNPQINYNNPHDIKSAYQYINRDQYGQWDIFDRKTSMLINSQQNHESWKRYTSDPKKVTTEEVVRFVWDYQFNEMYFRYFAWQFIGKEKWDEKTWERNSIDGKRLFTMPPLQGVDWLRYGLPIAFLIGLYGLYYQFKRDPNRALSVLVLFILTGIAIVVYLNQSDPQPRERDYAFVGSFFAFSIWIGIGCYGLITNIAWAVKNELPTIPTKPIFAAILFMSMPLNMMINDYYEHDRSQRYEAWDYAYNLLNSCETNGILFTNGDNDTFPLWYLQYVEKIRTDVKVVNLSLLNFPSYIKQLDEHSPSLKMFPSQPGNGIWDVGEKFIDKNNNQQYDYEEIFVDENENGIWDSGETYVDVNENNQYDKAEEFYDENISDEFINAIESDDMAKLTDLAQTNWFDESYPMMKIETPMGKKFNWEFKGGTYGLGLTNITIMNIIEKCFDNRPIYFSVTTGNNQLGLDDYLIQEGLVYKLRNQINMSPRPIDMDIKRTLEFLTITDYPQYKTDEECLDHGYKWDSELEFCYSDPIYRFTNLNKEGIFYGPHIERIAAVYRNIFHETANHMVLDINLENNIEASFSLRQLLNAYIPNTIVPENEDMMTYRTWEYYDGIIRYCMFMNEYENGVPSKTIIFIKKKMPDLYEYFKTQYPELIRID